MPHISVDYSPNMEERVNIAALCDVLRLAAIETGILPMPGIRVRAFCANHVRFIDISLRLRGGRPDDAKRAATAHIFAAAKDFLAPAMTTHSIALSFEMRDIDPDLSPKTGTIRDHLPKERP